MIRKVIAGSMFAFLGLVCFVTPQAEKVSAEGNAIKEVMNDAHKKGLLKEVLGGKANGESKNALLAQYVKLYEASCPGGDANSWLNLTGTLAVAASKVVVGREGAVAELKAASNCGACHKAHKGKGGAKKEEKKAEEKPAEKRRIKIDASHLLVAKKLSEAATSAAKAKYSIKEVMKLAHKDGLLKKVNGGSASKEEKLKLLDLYLSMWASEPSKGDINSWRKKVGDTVAAAAKVYLGQKDSIAQLKKASSCGGCHKPHK